jgi:hypothetical protein
VIAQIPATRVVRRIRRAQAFAAASALWTIALLGALSATLLRSELRATALLAGVAIVFAIGGVVLATSCSDASDLLMPRCEPGVAL